MRETEQVRAALARRASWQRWWAAGIVLVVVAAGLFIVAKMRPDSALLNGVEKDDPITLGWSEVDGAVPGDLLASTKTVNGDVPADLPRVVLLNFWASYCAPCREEMPLLQRLADDPATDVAVLGVSFDQDVAWARDFQTALAVRFANANDPQQEVADRLAQVYPVRRLPATILVVDGEARWIHLGAFKSYRALRQDVLDRIG